ncbi:hypothetical protein [Nannocystis pusilla]|uniref:hypothetical protein n=1 Tax=Nannocystis pusilla TaxID=889268 RepID=UPI003BF1B662
MQDPSEIDEILDAIRQNKPGAKLAFAAFVIKALQEGYPPDAVEQTWAALGLKYLREEALRAVLASREPKPPEPVDHFPDVERRGLLKTLGLRFQVIRGGIGGRDLFQVSADVPCVETGRTSTFSPGRWRKPGESDDEALRAAILNFFEHETDHGLWRDGKHIRDPDAQGDPHAI